MKYHAMISLLFDVNVPAQMEIVMLRGLGGTLRPADQASDLKVSSAHFDFIAGLAEQDIYEVWADQMRDSGAWEP